MGLFFLKNLNLFVYYIIRKTKKVMTKKIELSLSEIYDLDSELTGITNRQTGELVFKGLLSQTMSLKMKFWLTKLKTQTLEVVESVNKLRDDTIRKYGTEDETGNIQIPKFIKEGDETKVNPVFESFSKELSELVSEKKEIEHYDFKIDDFSSIETDNFYPVFFKLLEE